MLSFQNLCSVVKKWSPEVVADVQMKYFTAYPQRTSTFFFFAAFLQLGPSCNVLVPISKVCTSQSNYCDWNTRNSKSSISVNTSATVFLWSVTLGKYGIGILYVSSRDSSNTSTKNPKASITYKFRIHKVSEMYVRPQLRNCPSISWVVKTIIQLT